MNKIFDFLGYAVYVAGLISGAYIAGYLMFIKPILACCAAFDAGLLTGTMIGWTIVKCLFAGTVFGIIHLIGALIATYFWKK